MLRRNMLAVVPIVFSVALMVAGTTHLVGAADCPSYTFGTSYNSPPPCSTNTQCTLYSLVDENDPTPPCPNGNGNKASYYKSTTQVSGWGNCRKDRFAQGSCTEKYVTCMSATMYPTSACATNCGSIDVQYCAYPPRVVLQ